MSPERLEAILSRYPRLRIAVIGDFCLDRYYEIDPELRETSIETGLPVHNVTRIRSQPGGAGTILNNLAALGVGEIRPVGFHGDEGEGYELRRALKQTPRVRLDGLFETAQRRTFTYGKPLVLHKNKPPEELNRLDLKNWTPTPPELRRRLAKAALEAGENADAVILLEQTEIPEAGAVTAEVLDAARELAARRPELPILADSRRGLRGWPALSFKMNAFELEKLVGSRCGEPAQIERVALDLARSNRRPVFITLAERGILGAEPGGRAFHEPALPVRGPIDIVGAGDAVTANLAAALAAGASVPEALRLAMLAASIVIHQLGSTGAASPEQLRELYAETVGEPR